MAGGSSVRVPLETLSGIVPLELGADVNDHERKLADFVRSCAWGGV
jgi:hypothetical protein